MGNAGRVLMIPKGDYNPATPYEMLDCVYYNGRSYVCKQASTGHAPTDIMYWQPMTPDSSAEIQALTNYVAQKNVKNILPETIATQTNRGVTFTVNSDGSITLEGTCNATASVTIAESFPIKAGDYVYSKGATTGSATMYLYDTATFAEIAPTADHVAFNIASDRQIMARFYITNGTTYNATVYPMIVAKSVYDADPTYQPYAKTNAELTQDVAVETVTCTAGSNVTSLRASVFRIGKLVIGNFTFEGSCTSSDPILIIPEGYRPPSTLNGSGVVLYDGGYRCAYYDIESNGSLRQTLTSGATTVGTGSFAYLL